MSVDVDCCELLISFPFSLIRTIHLFLIRIGDSNELLRQIFGSLVAAAGRQRQQQCATQDHKELSALLHLVTPHLAMIAIGVATLAMLKINCANCSGLIPPL